MLEDTKMYQKSSSFGGQILGQSHEKKSMP